MDRYVILANITDISVQVKSKANVYLEEAKSKNKNYWNQLNETQPQQHWHFFF